MATRLIDLAAVPSLDGTCIGSGASRDQLLLADLLLLEPQHPNDGTIHSADDCPLGCAACVGSSLGNLTSNLVRPSTQGHTISRCGHGRKENTETINRRNCH